ncbi:MAG TPA: ABC transporter permease [Thermoanaerobaculia bacterium]|nr:ABC transporter permease [Thermoanaerobaculia bacterium]
MIRHLLKLVWNRKRANALIVAEIFISFLVVFAVLTGAIMFGTSWRNPIGFDWHNVWDISMEFDIDGGEKADPELHAAVMRMLDEARAFPEVESAALSNTPPYAFSTSEGSREVDGRRFSMIMDDVTDDFADVMKVKVVSGRFFNDEDDASPERPIVIDTNAAMAIFGTVDAVGKKLPEDDTHYSPVVGVIEPYRKDGETSLPMNMVFFRMSPTAKYGRLGSHILVRVRPSTPAVFEERLANRLQQIAPKVSFRVRHMDMMRSSALRTRFAPLILAGVVGLFLISMVTLGLTGVLWQNVTRRTRELGLRRALGASGPAVHRQILLEVALLATLAMIVGAILIVQLPILGVFKIVTPAAFTAGFVGALATIYGLTVLCGLYPSWLASRLQPADALRYE